MNLDNLIAAVAGALVAVAVYEYFRPEHRPAVNIDTSINTRAAQVVRLDNLVSALEHGLKGG